MFRGSALFGSFFVSFRSCSAVILSLFLDNLTLLQPSFPDFLKKVKMVFFEIVPLEPNLFTASSPS